jgi:hypothetical protein
MRPLNGPIFMVGPDAERFSARVEGGSLDGMTVDLPDRYPIYKHPVGADIEWYQLVETLGSEPFYCFIRKFRVSTYRWTRAPHTTGTVRIDLLGPRRAAP